MRINKITEMKILRKITQKSLRDKVKKFKEEVVKFNLKTNRLITEEQNEHTARIRGNKQVTKIERLDIKI
jgi:hypothetical protein